MDVTNIATVAQTRLVAPKINPANLASMELGVALVSGVGSGSILKLLDFGEPSTRVVPRSIEQNHVDALYQSVYGAFGQKNDHIWPVYLECSPRSLSTDTLNAMKHGSACDTSWCPPLLRLLSDIPSDLHLREGSSLRILDGAHQLAALVQEGIRCKEAIQRLKDKTKGRALSDTEKTYLESVVNGLDTNTWQCVVFSSDLLTDEARHYLSSYEDEDEDE